MNSTGPHPYPHAKTLTHTQGMLPYSFPLHLLNAIKNEPCTSGLFPSVVVLGSLICEALQDSTKTLF